MSNERLTNSLRDAICYRALDDAFGGRARALYEEENRLAELVWRDHYRSLLDTMLGLPEGFLPRVSQIRVNAAGQWLYLNFGGWRPIAAKDRHSCLGAYPADSVIGARIEKWRAAKDKLTDERDRARVALHALLRSVNTTKKLLELWPGAAAFIPKEEKAALPAVPVESVIAMLNQAKEAA